MADNRISNGMLLSLMQNFQFTCARALAAWHKTVEIPYRLNDHPSRKYSRRYWAGDVVRKSAHSERTPFLLINQSIVLFVYFINQ